MYNISDIKKGDKIVFRSTSTQSSFDEEWTVNDITDSKIHIELTHPPYNEYWTIGIEEVMRHESI